MKVIADLDDGSSKLLLDVSNRLQMKMASYPRRMYSS
jgi:hypothetical protein